MATRLAAAVAQRTGSAIAGADKNARAKEVMGLIMQDDIRQRLAKIYNDDAKAARFQIAARNAITRMEPDKIASLDPLSLAQCFVTMGELDLNPNAAMNEAYILPFYDRREQRTKAQLIIGYKGMMKIHKKYGDVERIDLDVIREGDKFEYGRSGEGDFFTHAPIFGSGGAIIGAYARIVYKAGGFRIAVMTIDQLLEARRRALTKKSGSFDWGHALDKSGRLRENIGSVPDTPWISNFESMCLKTVCRRALKYETLDVDALAQAQSGQADSRVEIKAWDSSGSGERPLDDDWSDAIPAEAERAPETEAEAAQETNA